MVPWNVGLSSMNFMKGPKISNRYTGFILKLLLSLVFYLTLSGGGLQAQSVISLVNERFNTTVERSYQTETLPSLRYWFIEPVSLPGKAKIGHQSILSMDPAYSYRHLGVVCKWEYRLEQTVNFPVKFRLGEYHYVQKLEGKPLHNAPDF